MTILIVDDEYYIVQKTIRDVNWDQLGIDSILTAFSAAQAQEILKEKHVDILLTDIEMPRMNGLDLIIWANEHDYKPISLILTGHQLFDYAKKAISLHCFGYILKPAPAFILEEELSSALEAIRLNGQDIPVPESNFLSIVKKCVLQNIGNENLNRAFIAEQIHMNPDYVSFLFHKEYGQALITYILNERISLAKKLLLSTNLTMQEICDQCGFSSTSYFHKQFKRIAGITPQQFKKIHMADDIS